MKAFAIIPLFIASAAYPSPSIGSHLLPPQGSNIQDAKNQQALSRLREAQVQAERGRFAEAELLARQSIEELAANPGLLDGHLALGKIYFYQGKYDDAWPELLVGWRRSNPEQWRDLIFAMAMSHHPGEHQQLQAAGVLSMYMRRQQQRITDLLCDLTPLMAGFEPKKVSAVAALLYSAEPGLRPGEALMHLKEAEKGLPKEPVVAYWRGMTYLKMNRKQEASKDLAFAAAAQGDIGAKARIALLKARASGS
jgi:tetratricopeptide (TPR) repeat protein